MMMFVCLSVCLSVAIRNRLPATLQRATRAARPKQMLATRCVRTAVHCGN